MDRCRSSDKLPTNGPVSLSDRDRANARSRFCRVSEEYRFPARTVRTIKWPEAKLEGPLTSSRLLSNKRVRHCRLQKRDSDQVSCAPPPIKIHEPNVAAIRSPSQLFQSWRPSMNEATRAHASACCRCARPAALDADAAHLLITIAAQFVEQPLNGFSLGVFGVLACPGISLWTWIFPRLARRPSPPPPKPHLGD